MRTKYIVGLALDNVDNRRLEAVLFANTLTHKDAAQLFGFGEHVVSAGFFQMHVTKPQDLSGDGTVVTAGGRIAVEVFGESESLQIGPQAFDKVYVARALGLVPADHLTRAEHREHYVFGHELVDARRKAEAAKK